MDLIHSYIRVQHLEVCAWLIHPIYLVVAENAERFKAAAKMSVARDG